MGFRLVYWDQWFSPRAILCPRVQGTKSGGIFFYHRDWEVGGERHNVTGTQWAETKMLSNTPQCAGKLKAAVSGMGDPNRDAHCSNSLPTALLLI